MISKARIPGNIVDEPDSFLDVAVFGIGTDGSIYLKDVDQGKEFTLPMKRIEQLSEENLLISTDRVGSSDLWATISDLQGDSEKVQEARRSLFVAAVEEEK